MGGSASNESPNINTNEASLQRSSSRSNSLQFSENQKQDVTAPQFPADTDKESAASTPSISQNSKNKKEFKTKKEIKEELDEERKKKLDEQYERQSKYAHVLKLYHEEGNENYSDIGRRLGLWPEQVKRVIKQEANLTGTFGRPRRPKFKNG